MANEGVDSQRPGELVKANQSLEKRNPERDYRSAKAALRNAWGQVEQEFAEQVLDNEGREIPAQTYLSGLRLGRKIVGEDAKRLQEEIVGGLVDKHGAFSDTLSPPMDMSAVGIIGAGMNLPIVEIPKVEFAKEGMSPGQVEELEELQRNVTRAGSVLLQVNFQPGSIKGGIVSSNLPEGLVMEDEPDTKVQIAFTPGFKAGRTKAQEVFDAVLDTETIKSARVPKDQLPPGRIIS